MLAHKASLVSGKKGREISDRRASGAESGAASSRRRRHRQSTLAALITYFDELRQLRLSLSICLLLLQRRSFALRVIRFASFLIRRNCFQNLAPL